MAKSMSIVANKAAARAAKAERKLAKAEAKLAKAEAKLMAKKAKVEAARQIHSAMVADAERMGVSGASEAASL